MMTLSPDQEKVLKNVLSWYHSKNKKQFLTIGGYAGTGKTTLIAVLREKIHKENKKLSVVFCSYTGKATHVLQRKLVESKALQEQDKISTIHGLIYSPIEDDNQVIIGWKLKSELEGDLIIIDEASMVDESIWKDLLSFRKPIIAVGDHGQLPPIKSSFNLMGKPELKLEKIHRQARENPIIKLSLWARERGVIPPGNYGYNIKKMLRTDIDAQTELEELAADYNKDTLILSGFNTTRIKLNQFVRQHLYFQSPQPQVNDRVLCLRNNHEKQVFNGMLGTITSIMKKDDSWYQASIIMDDEDFEYTGLIAKEQFNNPQTMNFGKQRAQIVAGDLFDFGYALTVHKAQGSQAKRVILFEERSQHMDDAMWRRWFYTAVTRAEEELIILGN